MASEDDTIRDTDAVESEQEADKLDSTYGCEHYLRKCSFVSPCCNKIYKCRLCHDASETHEINRHSVRYIVCQLCDTKQPVSNKCINCKTQFGNYYCQVCRLFDDNNKGQFHCDKCGICRVGGKDNFFHCDKCDLCLNVSLKNLHKCVEKVSHSTCPVCLEDLHSSVKNVYVPNCGHILHSDCMKNMLKSGNYACPICCQSMTDLSSYWSELDEEIAATPMPDEYKDTYVWILCRDCNKKCSTLFHVIGLKCHNCGSYNTCRDAEPTCTPTTDTD
jgi:RING finger/CHY zinc finger protein 1